MSCSFVYISDKTTHTPGSLDPGCHFPVVCLAAWEQSQDLFRALRGIVLSAQPIHLRSETTNWRAGVGIRGESAVGHRDVRER